MLFLPVLINESWVGRLRHLERTGDLRYLILKWGVQSDGAWNRIWICNGSR